MKAVMMKANEKREKWEEIVENSNSNLLPLHQACPVKEKGVKGKQLSYQ